MKLLYEIKFSYQHFLPKWECLYDKDDNKPGTIHKVILDIIRLGMQFLKFVKINQITDDNKIFKEVLIIFYFTFIPADNTVSVVSFFKNMLGNNMTENFFFINVNFDIM